MKQKFFPKLTKFLLLTAGLAWSQAQAEDFPRGSFENPIHDSSVTVTIVDQVYLETNASPSDSIKWITSIGNVFNENKILAPTDFQGKVYVKKEGLWKVGYFSYNGLKTYSGDSLLAPYLHEATYTWFFNGDQIQKGYLSYVEKPQPGTYQVLISAPAIPETLLVYTYQKYPDDGEGSTRDNAIYDPTILKIENNLFTSNLSMDSIVWEYTGSRAVNVASFAALVDGKGTLYARSNGKWRRADFAFFGIYQKDQELGAMVHPEGATYQWYLDGKKIAKAITANYSPSKSGEYKLEVKWNNTLFALNGKTGNYLINYVKPSKNDTLTSVIEVKDLIVREGNTLSVNKKYKAKSIVWHYNKISGFDSIYTATTPTLTLNFDAEVRLTVEEKKATYVQKEFFVYSSPQNNPGSMENPIDTLFVVRDGASLSVPEYFMADSVKWTVKDLSTNEISITFAPSITLLGDADVNVLAKSKGLWYREHFLFKGIVLDTLNKSLQAPIIENATYAWYLNDVPTQVTSSSLKPTEAGTYKVVIAWEEASLSASAQNNRLEGTTRIAQFSFVVSPVVVNSLADAAAVGGLELYPNPSNGVVTFSSVAGDISYSIHAMSGEQIRTGKVMKGERVTLDGLEQGIYLVKIQSSNSQITRKLIVK